MEQEQSTIRNGENRVDQYHNLTRLWAGNVMLQLWKTSSQAVRAKLMHSVRAPHRGSFYRTCTHSHLQQLCPHSTRDDGALWISISKQWQFSIFHTANCAWTHFEPHCITWLQICLDLGLRYGEMCKLTLSCVRWCVTSELLEQKHTQKWQDQARSPCHLIRYIHN